MIGAENTAAMTILDNDKPGVRLVEGPTITEGASGSEFFVSLLSQPTSNVTLEVKPQNTTRKIVVVENANQGATTLKLQINDITVEIAALACRNPPHLLAVRKVTLANAVTLFSDPKKATEVTLSSSLSGNIAPNASADYSYAELALPDGTKDPVTGNDTLTLTFKPDNWYHLQPITIQGIDDNVVETGALHNGTLSYQVISADPNYNSLPVPDQSVAIRDRTFDTQNVANFPESGFLGPAG